MDFCGQGAAFSHGPVEFLSTTSTVALTCTNAGKNLCIQMSRNRARFMNMDEDVNHFGESAGHTRVNWKFHFSKKITQPAAYSLSLFPIPVEIPPERNCFLVSFAL